MRTLYITEQNAYLRKQSKRFLIQKDDTTLHEIPAFKVERVVLFGNVQISTQAIQFLLKEGIETSFLTMGGKFMGRLVPTDPKNIYLRLNQYKAYSDPEFRLQFSKALVRSKLANGRRFMQRLAYSRELKLEKQLDEMSHHIRLVEQASSLGSLRGHEGRGTAAYFQGFSQMIEGFSFTERNRRPPKDPVNSLLSFGYVLLAGEIFAALSAGGLDPYLGFFHEIKYGRTSLCFDLCEEFRHLVVDGLVLDMVNHKRVQETDFMQDPETQGIILIPESRKKYLVAYERKMSGNRKNKEGEEESYRMAIHKQVEQLRDVLTKNVPYQGFKYS